MSEGRAPISSSRLATGDVARHSFATVRRGYDPDEVRSYLQSVSRSIEGLEEREAELRAALADAEERAAHPVVDEATLTTSLGQHSAQILRHAHEEAAKIVAQAQEGAATLMRETQVLVEELQATTEISSAERVAEVELLVAAAQQEAREESERMHSDAVAQGEAIIARAKDEGRTLLEQVQEARRRVLADLATRRRALGIQIEQLRAARDEMAATVHGVRDRVDGILAQLDRTDDEARAAALAVGEQYRLHGGEPDVGDAEGVAGEAALEGETDVIVTVEGDVIDDVIVVERPEGAPTTVIRIDGVAAEEESDQGAPSVDELFARIRAGADDGSPESHATDPGSRSQAEAAGAAGAESPVAPEAATEAVVVVEAATEAVAPEATGATTEAATEAATEAMVVVETPTEAVAVAEAEEAPAGPDDPLIARRDELLGPVTARLSRTVKRTLGDDQNRLLDRLRSAPSLSIEELLGPEDEQTTLYASAARGQLVEAFAAGTTFAGAGAAVPGGDVVDHSSSGLARVVVTMLRRRMEDGSEDPVNRIGAAFREWRGERVERLAGDYATQAFSAGVTSGGTDRKVRWVVTSSEGCSDCADNALAGAVSASETFPTGHVHPPAHSGCRCLVAPAGD